MMWCAPSRVALPLLALSLGCANGDAWRPSTEELQRHPLAHHRPQAVRRQPQPHRRLQISGSDECPLEDSLEVLELFAVSCQYGLGDLFGSSDVGLRRVAQNTLLVQREVLASVDESVLVDLYGAEGVAALRDPSAPGAFCYGSPSIIIGWYDPFFGGAISAVASPQLLNSTTTFWDVCPRACAQLAPSSTQVAARAGAAAPACAQLAVPPNASAFCGCFDQIWQRYPNGDGGAGGGTLPRSAACRQAFIDHLEALGDRKDLSTGVYTSEILAVWRTVRADPSGRIVTSRPDWSRFQGPGKDGIGIADVSIYMFTFIFSSYLNVYASQCGGAGGISWLPPGADGARVVPYLTISASVEPDVCVWDAVTIAGWIWSWVSGLAPSAALDTGYHLRLLDNGFDGPSLCSFNGDQLFQIGVPLSIAYRLADLMQQYNYGVLAGAPGLTYKIPGFDDAQTSYPERPFNVSVGLVVDSVAELSELTFTYEARFTLVVSWEDDRIRTRCAGYGKQTPNNEAEAADAQDICSHYWRPQFNFLNIYSFEEGGYELLSDSGLYTEVGAHVGRASDPHQYLNHSIGYFAQKYKMLLQTPMGFHYFPFDCQNLLIRIHPTEPGDTIRLVATSSISPKLLEFSAEVEQTDAVTLLAGWNVTGVSHHVATENVKSVYAQHLRTAYDDPTIGVNARRASVTQVETAEAAGLAYDPLFAMMVRTSAGFSPNEVGTIAEVLPAGGADTSAATFSIQIIRLTPTYIFNFVLLVMMLITIAFTSFLFDSSAMNDRVNLTLTVFLGVIFFQFLIVEKLPASGTLTIMHSFMCVSSLFNGLIVILHILIWFIHQYAAEQIEALRRVQMFKKHRRAIRSAIVVQRMWRRQLITRKAKLTARSEQPAGKHGPRTRTGARARATSRGPANNGPPLGGPGVRSAAIHSVQIEMAVGGGGAPHGAPAAPGVLSAAALPGPLAGPLSSPLGEMQFGPPPAESLLFPRLSHESSGGRPMSQFQAGLEVARRMEVRQRGWYRLLKRMQTIGYTLLLHANWFVAAVTVGLYFVVVVWLNLFLVGEQDAKCNGPPAFFQTFADPAGDDTLPLSWATNWLSGGSFWSAARKV